MNLELGSIVKLYFEEDLYKVYIVSEFHVDDLIGVKYALVGMNGTVYSNMYFSNLEDLEIQLKLEYSYEISKVNQEKIFLKEYLIRKNELSPINLYANNAINKDYMTAKTYSTNYCLESVINKFINDLPGRWGIVTDIRTSKEKLSGNYFKGELLIENKRMFKIEVLLIRDVRREAESYWQCKAEIME
ncbi:hypothetical protein [Bacillus thuringiensis]|uniref:hypothetical protein n=1 Tax=Bacillus thuringiensis TaxID=1428 RepID=UPI002FBD6B14